MLFTNRDLASAMHPTLAFQTSGVGFRFGSAGLRVSKCRSGRRILNTGQIRCTASKPDSTVDSQQEQEQKQAGLPEPGQIVLTPGKWADEDGVGLVEQVRFVESRGSYVVDVVQLRRAEDDVFELGRGRGKSTYNWYDIEDVRVADSAEYLESRSAYRVKGARDGYAFVQPMDEAAKQEADAQYEELKRYMLGVTAAFGAVGTLAFTIAVDMNHGRAFGLGALASIVYLFLLQENVNRLGDQDSWLKKALGLRFVLPAIPFLFYARLAGGGSDTATGALFGALKTGIPKTQVAAIVLGLLSYKVPVLLKTASEAIDSLAEIKPGTSGMIGTVASLAARSIRERRDGTDGEGAAEGPNMSTALVFAGPSGVGKSTLISMLAQDFPDSVSFSVSHTTRPPRDREEEGNDYYFVTAEKFDEMVSTGEFIEHARVHDRCYGTSYESVRNVTRSGKICIIDVDIQGIEALRKKAMKDLDWFPRFVWVAPPSFEVLEQRLRARSTESEESIKLRLDNAKRELTFAATNSIFDLTIINGDLQSSYSELKQFFESVLKQIKKSAT